MAILRSPMLEDIHMLRKQKLISALITKQLIDNDLTAIGVVDFDALTNTVNELQTAFSDNFQHTFAVKANALIEVLKKICSLGMGAEVASPGELKLALAAGFKCEQIIFDSPAKTLADLRACLKAGISINIDNLQELARLDQLISDYPDTRSVIGFRVNPQIGTGRISSTSTATSTSKFGFPLADGDNTSKLIDIYTARPWLTSIHTHSGSQGCPLDLMVSGIKKVTELAEKINTVNNSEHQQITRLDIGGGLPVNFSSEEVTPKFSVYAELLKKNIPKLFTGKYQVKTEFGRTIVAKNGVIITRVEYTKNSGGRHIAITHAGAQILTRTSFLPTSWPIRVSEFSSTGELKTAATDKMVNTDIAGPCCFAGDLICKDQLLPKLNSNDFVMIHDTGGYYFSNHFDYNSLPRVAVYAISGDNQQLTIKCIRVAQSLEQLVNSM